jgi:tetratricopeptide (TPR) repeat protein
MGGNYAKALEVIANYEKTQSEEKDKPKEPNYDDSELALYKNQIIEESGDHAGALAHLGEIEKIVVDQLGWKERKAALLVELKRPSDAAAEYRSLVQYNPEHYAYHLSLRQNLGLGEEKGMSVRPSNDRLFVS